MFTTSCTPFLVPNSPQGFTTTAANPDIPEIDGVPCTGGRSSGACIGLAENEAAAGPAAGTALDHQRQPITEADPQPQGAHSQGTRGMYADFFQLP